MLAFKSAGDKYHATIVLNISQYKGTCYYDFGRVWYAGEELPSLETIQNSDIIGTKSPALSKSQIEEIVAMHSEDIYKLEVNIQTLLHAEAEKTNAFAIGLDKLGIEHRYLKGMVDKFQKIGEISIKPEYLLNGAYTITGNYESFSRFFLTLEDHMPPRKIEQFKIKDLCRQSS